MSDIFPDECAICGESFIEGDTIIPKMNSLTDNLVDESGSIKTAVHESCCDDLIVQESVIGSNSEGGDGS